MTKDQFEGLVRALLAYAGGWATAKGYVTSEQWLAILGAVPAVVAAVWSFRSKQHTAEGGKQ